MKLQSLKQLNLDNRQPTLSKESKLNYSTKSMYKNLKDEPDSYNISVSFGKKGNLKDAKKIVNSIKKGVGEISKNPQPEVLKGDKFLNSPFFDKLLNVVDYEPVIASIVAAVACGARAATLKTMPGDKTDNTYAAGHAVASGAIGLLTSIILTPVFKNSADHVMKEMLKNLNVKTLKRLYPHLDIKSIGTEGNRLDIKSWKNIDGNKFISSIQDCAMLPQFKQLSDVSEETFNKILKVDADWVANKGKSFNDVVLKDGKSLYDSIDMKRLGFAVKEDGFDTAHILFKDLDKEYLQKIINDAKNTDSNWKNLDIKSVYDEAGNVVDFRQWKNVEGKQWKLDLDEVFVSSPLETATYKPRISGKKRFDAKDKEYKFRTYQENGVGKLGTEITDEMLKADNDSEIIKKLLTWSPDLVFRIPIAMMTVDLIPWVLKNVFGVEKKSKKNQVQQQKQEINNNINNDKSNVAFKGKDKGAGPIARFFAKIFSKPMIESDFVSKLASKLNKIPGTVTEHMATFGSLLTSGMYVTRTLNKDDLEPDRRRTLAINQALCFVVPTIAAYTVNKLINKWVKEQGYRYTGLKNKELNDVQFGKLQGEAKDEAVKIVNDKLKKTKGIRILASLTVFTLIYRYVTPVIITPIANWIGNKINNRHKAIEENQNK